MLYWITGLAGAGKTTIGRALYTHLKKNNPGVVLLDGDELRSIVGGRFGYSAQERKECSMFYSRLCKSLTDQGLDVICCVCAMFNEVRQWNRDNIAGYTEVFVNPPMDVLRSRNQKGLYTDSESEVYGVTLEAELPDSPDIVLQNNGSLTAEEQVELILKEVQK